MKPHTLALLLILFLTLTAWIVGSFEYEVPAPKPPRPPAGIVAKELCVCGEICRHGHDCGIRECDGRRK